MEQEVRKLKRQVNALFAIYLCLVIIFTGMVIHFQIQYAAVQSYYQSTTDLNQQILLNQKWQNSELQRSLSMIEDLLPD